MESKLSMLEASVLALMREFQDLPSNTHPMTMTVTAVADSGSTMIELSFSHQGAPFFGAAL
jgi:hypothetical protein